MKQISEALLSDDIARDTVVVAASGTNSSAIDLRGFALCGIFTPASLEATSLTLQESPDSGATWFPMHDASGTLLAIPCGASRKINLNPADFAGVGVVRVVLGTAASGASRTLTLIARKLG